MHINIECYILNQQRGRSEKGLISGYLNLQPDRTSIIGTYTVLFTHGLACVNGTDELVLLAKLVGNPLCDSIHGIKCNVYTTPKPFDCSAPFATKYMTATHTVTSHCFICGLLKVLLSNLWYVSFFTLTAPENVSHNKPHSLGSTLKHLTSVQKRYSTSRFSC